MTLTQLIWCIILTIISLPGGGHWRLKKRKRAAIFMLPTLLVIVGLFAFILRIVSKQVREIGATAHALDVTALSQKLSANLYADHEIGMKVFIFLLIVCYVTSIADLVWLYQSRPQD